MRSLSDYSDAERKTYIQALAALAHTDGVHEREREYIKLQAECVGLCGDEALLNSELPPATDLVLLPDCLRNLIFRDLITLGHIDGSFSETEWERVQELARLMDYPIEKVGEIERWLQDYWEVLQRGEELFAG